MTERVWDVGLQPERTGLAWRRLGLTLVGIGFALPKVAFGLIGWWSLPATALALACGVLILTVGHRRYGQAHRALTAEGALTAGGRLPLVITAVVLAVGLTAVGTLFA